MVGLIARDLLVGLPGHHLWLHCEGDQVLGAIALQHDAGTRRAQLGRFVVHSTVRGTGTGQMLLQAALAQADQEALALETSLITRVQQMAPPAEVVYCKAGFSALQTQAEDLRAVPVLRTRYARQRPAPP